MNTSQANDHANDVANGHENGQPHNHTPCSFLDDTVNRVASVTHKTVKLRGEIELLRGISNALNRENDVLR